MKYIVAEYKNITDIEWSVNKSIEEMCLLVRCKFKAEKIRGD